MADKCEGQGKGGHFEKKIEMVKDRVMNNQKRGIKERVKRDGGASEERLASILEKEKKAAVTTHTCQPCPAFRVPYAHGIF